MTHSWDREVDVLVAGSGAAGLTAAITFASGVGLGLLLAPRRSSNNFRPLRQGILPVAAVALSHAVLEAFDQTRA